MTKLLFAATLLATLPLSALPAQEPTPPAQGTPTAGTQGSVAERETRPAGDARQQMQRARRRSDIEGNTSGGANHVVFRHCDPLQTVPITLSIGTREDLWVHIPDANRLTYSYSVGSTPDAADAAFRDALSRLLGVGTTGGGGTSGRAALVADQGKVDDFDEFADAITAASTATAHVIRTFDDCSADTPDHEEQLERISDELPVAYLNSASFTRAELTRLAQAASDAADAAARPRIESRRAAADALIDPLTLMWRELQAPPVGDVYQLYKHGTATQVVELRIQNRLGDAYRPLRAVPAEPIRVATIGTRAPAAVFSMGVAAIAGRRTEYSLEPLTGADAGKFRVVSQEHDDLSLAPTGFFTLQRAWYNGLSLGGTLGVGVNGDIRELDETTDLIAGITTGFRGAYLTIGAAYTSDITKLPDLGEGNITTDPNILVRADRDRAIRFVAGLHVRP